MKVSSSRDPLAYSRRLGQTRSELIRKASGFFCRPGKILSTISPPVGAEIAALLVTLKRRNILAVARAMGNDEFRGGICRGGAEPKERAAGRIRLKNIFTYCGMSECVLDECLRRRTC